MTLPLIIALGENIFGFFVIGLPATIGGILCLFWGSFIASRNPQEDRKKENLTASLLAAGVLLLVIAFFSSAIARKLGL